MLFSEVIGQQNVKQQLIEMVQHNRLGHALLFLGREGTGALPLALAFSQYVALLPPDARKPAGTDGLFGIEEAELRLPAGPGEADDWMRKQPSFRKAMELQHPDIHFSFPVVPKKSGTPPVSADYINEWREFIRQLPYGNVYDWLQSIEAENRQGNITSQECNDIIHKLSLKSFENGYRVLVMWMPEYLGREGNKLLKIIEEPPPDTLFILVAENESAILSTLLSRCQLVKIPALHPSAIEEALLLKDACSPEQARILANASGGSYREAIHLLQHSDEDFYSQLKDWLNATLKNQVVAQAKMIEDLSRLGREKQKQFFRYFIHLIEQSIRLELLPGDAGEQLREGMSDAEQDFTRKLSGVMTLEQKNAIAEELATASFHIERNANARILLHALSIRIFHIVRNNVLVTT